MLAMHTTRKQSGDSRVLFVAFGFASDGADLCNVAGWFGTGYFRKRRWPGALLMNQKKSLISSRPHFNSKVTLFLLKKAQTKRLGPFDLKKRFNAYARSLLRPWVTLPLLQPVVQVSPRPWRSVFAPVFPRHHYVP